MGFSAAARRAGTNPNTTPTLAEAAIATRMITGLMYMGQPSSFAMVNATGQCLCSGKSASYLLTSVSKSGPVR